MSLKNTSQGQMNWNDCFKTGRKKITFCQILRLHSCNVQLCMHFTGNVSNMIVITVICFLARSFMTNPPPFSKRF